MNIIPVDKKITLEIANLYLIGRKPEEIANQINLPVNQVEYILAGKDAQDYIQKSASNKELQLHLTRLNRAYSLLDTIIDKIEEFVNSDTPLEKWKDSQVNLIKDFLYNKLPDTIGKTVKTAIQINIGNQQEQKSDDGFTNKINKIPNNKILEFWDIVDLLVSEPAYIDYIYNIIHNDEFIKDTRTKKVPNMKTNSENQKTQTAIVVDGLNENNGDS